MLSHTPEENSYYCRAASRNLGGENVNLFDLITVLLRVLSFKGFLRFSEVINLKISGVVSKETYMSIFIEKSKIGIYREGYWLDL